MGTFMGITFIIIVTGAIILWVQNSLKKRTTVVVSDDSFFQNGVRVDFTARTITIKENTYSVDKVTGIKTVNDTGDGVTVYIEVDDFVKPVHKVPYRGTTGRNHAAEFVQRLSMALRKANGPNFV